MDPAPMQRGLERDGTIPVASVYPASVWGALCAPGPDGLRADIAGPPVWWLHGGLGICDQIAGAGQCLNFKVDMAEGSGFLSRLRR
jgi:hypothetical protein